MTEIVTQVKALQLANNEAIIVIIKITTTDSAEMFKSLRCAAFMLFHIHNTRTLTAL
jgi:hypothetical protein